MRIVSLNPACTEWVAAFGATNELVGRSHACDFPPAVRSVPAVTRCSLHAENSAEIDAAVREHAGSLHEIDAGLLARLRPDIILAQTQCDVCGTSIADVDVATKEWDGRRPEVFGIGPATLKDALDTALRLGKAIGRLKEAMAYVGEAERRLRAMQRRVGVEKRALNDHLPTVVCIEWLDPVMTAGHWTPNLVELAGGQALATTEGEPSRYVEWSEIRAANPDVLAIMPCGFDLDATRKELKTLFEKPGWDSLNAVRNGRVYVFDGKAYFNRPGPRLYRSIELMARALHPSLAGIDAAEWEMEVIKTW